MTGMKEGAGEDPFANDPEDSSENDSEASSESDPEGSSEINSGGSSETGSESGPGSTDPQSNGPTDESDNMTENGRAHRSGSAGEAGSGSTGADTGSNGTDRTTPGRQQSMRIPYKFRRDGVQDGRDRVPLFLMPETKSAERDALREFEDRFDENVSLTDLREAVMKAGLQHLDDVEDELAAWGYGVTFDE